MHRLVKALFSLLFLILLLGRPSLAADVSENRSILVIWGDPFIGGWEENFNQILNQELVAELGMPLIPEFLSLLKTDDQQQKLIAESLRMKYSYSKIELVIAVLPEANTFVHGWGSIFAPDTPVLYVLPGNDVTNDVIDGETEKILGSAVSEATTNTLDLIFDLFPDTQKLYALSGASAGDLSYLEWFRDTIGKNSIDLNASYVSGLPPDEALSMLADAPNNSVVLLATYNSDNTGQAYRTLDVGRKLSGSDVPVFAVFDELIISGAIGGSVTSSTLYAEKTVEFANKLLSGEQFDSSGTSATNYMFDGGQLDRFNVDRNRLPEGSVIINDSISIFRDYILEISILGAVIVLLLVLVATLLHAMARRKFAEKELQELHKLEALGSLAGGIAHDFNNILMAIVGNAELVSLNSDKPDMVNKISGNILIAADRAKRLVTQILMFGRSSQEKIEDSVNLETLFQETIGQLRAASPNSLNVVIRTDPGLWQVRANATQIHQVLVNLCVNAEYAMNSDGVISINVKNETVVKPRKLAATRIAPGDYVAIEIADNGTGIDNKDLARIFEPFFTTKPFGQGSGLGLSLVQRIIKLHEGYLDVESVLGRGTTVTVYLNANHGTSEKLPVSTPSSTSLGRAQRIMLVDDDEMIIDSSQRMLVHQGYVVEAYTQPAEAFRNFSKSPLDYALMITDLTMAEMDGLKLFRKVRDLSPELPVILRTGYSDALEEQELAGLENFTILSKPCSMDDTLEAIAKALAR